MKIKTWLLLSYLIVMIIPLLAAYLLFAWITSYNDEQKVREYFTVTNQVQEIKSLLDDPELYHLKSSKEKIAELANEQLSIVLYNKDGLVLSASSPTFSTNSALGKKHLYEGLYDLKQGFRAYSYKQPVFDKQDIVGFFYIEIARNEWVTGVSNRSLITFGIFIAIFILVYWTIVRLVNRKLNKRLMNLMREMSAFAAGQTIKETKTNHDEIGELQRHFYDMRRQIHAARKVIEQEQQAKEYMIATISHDLKTPLTSIKAYAESLNTTEELTVNERKEYQKVIIEKSDFIKQMLDDLLTYTLLRSPSYELEFVPVDGSEFFEMLVSDYEPLCKEKLIQLHSDAHVRGTYEVNPKQLMRVVDNLMSNAIKHTASRQQIWLTALSDDNVPYWLFDFIKKDFIFQFDKYAYVIVQNEGNGMTKDHLGRIFDPLYQVDQARSKRAEHGTGLGLSITKQIIEKHGGKVSIFSRESIGTCVICSLPRKRKGCEHSENDV